MDLVHSSVTPMAICSYRQQATINRVVQTVF